jgi:succinate-acetate transporter protein
MRNCLPPYMDGSKMRNKKFILTFLHSYGLFFTCLADLLIRRKSSTLNFGRTS